MVFSYLVFFKLANGRVVGIREHPIISVRARGPPPSPRHGSPRFLTPRFGTTKSQGELHPHV